MASVPRTAVVYCEDGEDDDTTDLQAPFTKRAKNCTEGITASQRPAVTAPADLSGASARVLLRRVFFLNEEKTRYVSVGFYPSENYRVLVEFGGPRIVPIRLAEQHVRTLMEALPALCDAMRCCKLFTRKDGAFRIRSSRGHNCARLYHGKRSVGVGLADLRYMATMLHVVETLQNQYILAQADVMSYAYSALSSMIFAVPQRTSECPIPYDQLCVERKLQLL